MFSTRLSDAAAMVRNQAIGMKGLEAMRLNALADAISAESRCQAQREARPVFPSRPLVYPRLTPSTPEQRAGLEDILRRVS